MPTSAGLPVEERLRQLCTHLGIRRAHVAARMPEDWLRFVTTAPERCASLTLVGGAGITPAMVGPLASRLLLFHGDQGADATQVRRGMDHLPGAQLVTLRDYHFLPWMDALAERTDAIVTPMLTFLAQTTPPARWEHQPPAPADGEVAGMTYRLRGAGPPLLLLPLGLSPSQWEPVIPQLSAHYCTITLGGAALGIVANLESRGQAAGYRGMLRTLLAEVAPLPGEALLEVGCGSGAVARWLAQETCRAHRITAVDRNPYLLREATALAQQAGLTDTLTFHDGRAEALPFADQTFDVALAVTVLEEGDADRMLTEMLRVTRPGGRIGVIVRAYDRPFLINLPLRPALLQKLEEPSSWAPGVSVGGCADASLYRRFHQAGLTAVKMLPQLAAFDGTATVLLEFLLNRLLPTLAADEALEWQTAQAQAAADGTFWIAWPHHCAVGTKP